MSEELKAGLAGVMDKDADVAARPRNKRKRKVSFLTTNKIYVVDYKDTALLRKFINDRGKMVSSRQSGTTAKQQRQVAKAIKLAREMALLPFVVTEMNTERRERRSEAPAPAPAPAAAAE
jgi:small subunit ribosomal protein S18